MDEETLQQMKQDFQELCDIAQKFMKNYGQDYVYLVIDKKEIKLMTCDLFKKFEETEKK